jgi:hypothetical protein
MSQRLCATILQPCILCEQTQERWEVWIDEEYDVEAIVRVEMVHTCPGMKRVLAERRGTQQYVRKAT